MTIIINNKDNMALINFDFGLHGHYKKDEWAQICDKVDSSAKHMHTYTNKTITTIIV